MESINAKTYDNYIKALMDISRVITSDRYLDDILKLIVMVTAKVTGVEICSLWLIDETATPVKIVLKASQTIDPEYMHDRSLDLNEGVVGFVASTKQPLTVPDVLTEPLFKEKEMARKLGLVSMVSVPLQVHAEKVVGVLNCFTAVPHDFIVTEVNLIKAVANQAAAAIMNTELMVKTRVIQEELETRKKVEKAKGILMKEQGFDEAEAFKLIQRSSMDKRVSMKDIAEAIILTFEIKKI